MHLAAMYSNGSMHSLYLVAMYTSSTCSAETVSWLVHERERCISMRDVLRAVLEHALYLAAMYSVSGDCARCIL